MTEMQAMQDRECTCHPDDNPPNPCAKRYAFSECIAQTEDQKMKPSRTITKVEVNGDPRRPLWQRWPTDMICRNGRIEIAKVAEIAGYVIVVTIMCRAWERLLDNPFALSLLVSCLLFPSIAKKLVGKFAK